MKGRLTSFQRFAGMVGVQGSVLNKWAKGNETRRDMFTPDSSIQPTDYSDGKGIYNLTVTTNKELIYDKTGYPPTMLSGADMGEEVYGCIVSGYTKNLKEPKLEYSADEAINNRRERKDYPEGKDHFSEVGRIWGSKDKDNGYIDSVCIPTENIPLVANSKFEIKYWEQDASKIIEIPKGAGFTSGTLVRPVAFSSKAGELKNGSRRTLDWDDAGATFLRSHVLKAVPIKTAHAILNRCKEILLTGSVDYSIERTNKECSGVQKSKLEWEEEIVTGCPPGSCVDIGGSISLTCASTKLTTKVSVKGDIEMTAYRHKQIIDVWNDPKPLDVSGNYFEGRLGNKFGYNKVSNAACEDTISDSTPTKMPIPQIEQLAEFEKQEKLTSGCLTYPSTNSSMLNAALGENLKRKDIDIDNCTKSWIDYSLWSNYDSEINFSWNYISTQLNPGGVNPNSSIICPQLASGPNLRALFLGNGWDYSNVGKEGPEDVYSDPGCKDGEATNFYDYKGTWHSTGLVRGIESGDCPLGIQSLARYNPTSAPACKCGDACEYCKSFYGELRPVCECVTMCSPYNSTSCGQPNRKSKCDGTYAIAMEIGKYVGVQSDNNFYNVAAVPLSAKMDTKTEDLTIWWNGAISHPDAVGQNVLDSLSFFLNEESAKDAYGITNSLNKWDSENVGELTIVCDGWSTSVPLWGVYAVAKENTCKGYANGTNTYSTSKLAATKQCAGCDEDSEDPDCCSKSGGGCGGVSGESNGCCDSEPCGILDPCGYAVTAISSAKCKQIGCGGTCWDNESNECGCCGCDFEGDYCPRCPSWTTCTPYKIISDYQEMGCYGDAHEEDKHKASVNLTLEFKLFTEME